MRVRSYTLPPLPVLHINEDGDSTGEKFVCGAEEAGIAAKRFFRRKGQTGTDSLRAEIAVGRVYLVTRGTRDIKSKDFGIFPSARRKLVHNKLNNTKIQ